MLGLIISGQLLPIGTPPSRIEATGKVPTGHVVCRISIRSKSAEVKQAIEEDTARFLRELFSQTLVEGIHAGKPLSSQETLFHSPCCHSCLRLMSAAA